MLDMKKKRLDEVVRENKADEMSAMYNMILHKKQLELGGYSLSHMSQINSHLSHNYYTCDMFVVEVQIFYLKSCLKS